MSAISYAVVREGYDYIGDTFNVYEDALAKAKKMAEAKGATTHIYQSHTTVGVPKAPLEVSYDYFDYNVNVKKTEASKPILDLDDDECEDE